MGNTSSLSAQELATIEQETKFNQKQIKRVYKSFKKLDKTNKGYISYSDLMKLPELSKNPLGDRIIRQMTNSSDDPEVDFKKLIAILDTYNRKDNEKEKYRVLFKIYDTNKDGFIDENELFSVLKTIVGGDLNDIQLKEIVVKTLREADLDKDGKLNFEEFSSILNST